MTAAPWYVSQPIPVRVVLDIAALRDGEHDDAHDRMVTVIFPEHADTIREIADRLYWIDRLTTENPRDVLREYHGSPAQIRWYDADQVADELVARLRTDALCKAQLIASLLRVGVTA